MARRGMLQVFTKAVVGSASSPPRYALTSPSNRSSCRVTPGPLRVAVPSDCWRGAFALIVPVAVLALVWQRIHMPSLPPRGIRRTNPLGLLSQPQVALGMASIFLLFMGQFALFTYLRPYLEGVAGFSVSMLSGGFLALGLAGLAGTWAISHLLRTRLYGLLIVIPAVMAGLAVLMIASAQAPVGVGALIVFGGSLEQLPLSAGALGLLGRSVPKPRPAADYRSQ
jgi:predicted MFS family arabinose efflux permease